MQLHQESTGMAAQNGVMKGGHSLVSRSLNLRGGSRLVERDTALSAVATKRHDADKGTAISQMADVGNGRAKNPSNCFASNSAWHPPKGVARSYPMGPVEVKPTAR